MVYHSTCRQSFAFIIHDLLEKASLKLSYFLLRDGIIAHQVVLAREYNYLLIGMKGTPSSFCAKVYYHLNLTQQQFTLNWLLTLTYCQTYDPITNHIGRPWVGSETIKSWDLIMEPHLRSVVLPMVRGLFHQYLN